MIVIHIIAVFKKSVSTIKRNPYKNLNYDIEICINFLHLTSHIINTYSQVLNCTYYVETNTNL